MHDGADAFRWDTLDALSRAIELCDIGPGSSVVAVVDDHSVATLLRAVLDRLGTNAVTIRPPAADRAGLDRLARGPFAEPLTEAADLLIDSTRLGLEGAWPVPVLRLHRPLDAHDHPPHANLASRVRALRSILDDAEAVELHDEWGSHLSIDARDAALDHDAGQHPHGATSTTFPAGWVSLEPGPDTVSGTLIVLPGDANLALGRHIASPIRLTIEHDLVTSIDGDHGDADLLRTQIERADDPHVYGLGAITIGLNPGRSDTSRLLDPNDLDPVHARLRAGAVTVTIGDNRSAGRPSEQRVTLALANRSITVDGTTIVDAGTLRADLAPDVYEQPG